MNWSEALRSFGRQILPALIGALISALAGLRLTVPQGAPVETPPPIVHPPLAPVTPPVMPPSPKGPKTKEEATKATGKLRVQGGGCSVTVIGPRQEGSCYYALSSAHCFRGVGKKCWVTVGPLKDYEAVLVYMHEGADVALIKICTFQELPYILLNPAPPKNGDQVWHKGYGVDKPGNYEVGRVLFPGNVRQATSHTVSLSSGDSGSGLFLESTNHLVAVNHSGGRGTFYGTSWHQLAEGLKQISGNTDLANSPFVGHASVSPSVPAPSRP